jgi:negative regulator of PHO system
MSSTHIEIIPGNSQIARGAFGSIDIAVGVNPKSSSLHHVALKVIRGAITTDESLTLPVFNELAALRSTSHQNVIPLLSVHAWKDDITFVFPFCPVDLLSILQTFRFRQLESLPIHFTRLIMQDIFKGLAHCHENHIVHCDMKPGNIFLSSKGYFQLADFGLAQRTEQSLPATGLCTLPYRPPELLLGSESYAPSIDIWGAGVIFAELLTCRPLFYGTSVLDQLSKIMNVLGTPSTESWPSIIHLPDYYKVIFEKKDGIGFHCFISKVADDTSLESLLSQLIVMNPERRLSAEEALKHCWIQGESASRSECIECLVPDEYKTSSMEFSNSKFDASLEVMKQKGKEIAIAKRNESVLK